MHKQIVFKYQYTSYTINLLCKYNVDIVTYYCLYNLLFQSKWISILVEPKESQNSFYWKKVMGLGDPEVQSHTVKRSRRVKDILFNPWPLNALLPDMVKQSSCLQIETNAIMLVIRLQVEEVKHYMHGVAQVNLPQRGVVFKVKMAEDVLYNEVNHNVYITIFFTLITQYFY